MKIIVRNRSLETSEIAYIAEKYRNLPSPEELPFSVEISVPDFFTKFEFIYNHGIGELLEYNQRTGIFEIPYGNAKTYPNLDGYLNLSHEYNLEMTTLFRTDLMELFFGTELTSKTKFIIRRIETCRIENGHVAIRGFVSEASSTFRW